VVAPVFHKYEFDAVEVNVTEFPGQKVVVPFAEITGVVIVHPERFKFS